MTKQRVAIDVDFHQYYITDSVNHPSWPDVDGLSDGILSPGETGARVLCGIQWGILAVDVEIRRPGAAIEAQRDLIASASDLVIPSKVLQITDWGGDVKFSYTLTQGNLCRIWIRVERRDDGEYVPLAAPNVELHTLHIWEPAARSARWRTEQMDHQGQRALLQQL